MKLLTDYFSTPWSISSSLGLHESFDFLFLFFLFLNQLNNPIILKFAYSDY